MPDVSTKDIDEYINLSKLFLDKNFDHLIISNFLSTHEGFKEVLKYKEDIKKPKKYFNYLLCNFLYTDFKNNSDEFYKSFINVLNEIKNFLPLDYTEKLCFLFLKQPNFINTKIYNKCINKLIDFFKDKKLFHLFFESKIWEYQDFFISLDETNQNFLLDEIINFLKNNRSYYQNDDFLNFNASFFIKYQLFDIQAQIIELFNNIVKNWNLSSKQNKRINNKIIELQDKLVKDNKNVALNNNLSSSSLNTDEVIVEFNHNETQKESYSSLIKTTLSEQDNTIILNSNVFKTSVSNHSSSQIISTRSVVEESKETNSLLVDKASINQLNSNNVATIRSVLKDESIKETSSIVINNHLNIVPIKIDLVEVASNEQILIKDILISPINEAEEIVKNFVDKKVMPFFKFILSQRKKKNSIDSTIQYILKDKNNKRIDIFSKELFNNLLNNLLEDLFYSLDKIPKKILLNNIISNTSFKLLLNTHFVNSIASMKSNFEDNNYLPFIYIFLPQFENIFIYLINNIINKDDIKVESTQNDENNLLKLKDIIEKIKTYLIKQKGEKSNEENVIFFDCLYFFLSDINGFNIRNKYIHPSLYDSTDLSLDINEEHATKLIIILFTYLVYFVDSLMNY